MYLYNTFLHSFLYIDNFAFETISYCMNLHHPAVIMAAHYQSLRAWRIFRAGENYPRHRFKKRKGEKKKRAKEKQASQKLWWNPVLANASRKFD